MASWWTRLEKEEEEKNTYPKNAKKHGSESKTVALEVFYSNLTKKKYSSLAKYVKDAEKRLRHEDGASILYPYRVMAVFHSSKYRKKEFLTEKELLDFIKDQKSPPLWLYNMWRQETEKKSASRLALASKMASEIVEGPLRMRMNERNIHEVGEETRMKNTKKNQETKPWVLNVTYDNGVEREYASLTEFVDDVENRRRVGLIYSGGDVLAEFNVYNSLGEFIGHRPFGFLGEEDLFDFVTNQNAPSWLVNIWRNEHENRNSQAHPSSSAEKMSLEVTYNHKLAERRLAGGYRTIAEFVDAYNKLNVDFDEDMGIEAVFTTPSKDKYLMSFRTERELLRFCVHPDAPRWMLDIRNMDRISNSFEKEEPDDLFSPQQKNSNEEKLDEEKIPAPEGSLEQYLEMVVGKAARSNKHGFKITEKLKEIERILSESGSPYHLVRKTDHSWIFGQKDMEDGQSVIMVSSHADIVDNITKPHSELNHEKDYYRGTYDNAGTNAVCTHLMAKEELPEDVYFAFTAEEETGRCSGAEDALGFVRGATGKEPMILALDVTDEGYENDRLFTVEGLHGVNELSRRKMLDVFLSTEGNEQSFEVIKLKKKDDNSFLPEKYQGEGLTVFDESVFYSRKGCNSCSICLPGDGEMHGDDGFKVKRAVMEGYEVSLLANIYALEMVFRGDRGHLSERIEELKEKKDALVKEAAQTDFWKRAYYGASWSWGSSGYEDTNRSYYNDYGYRSFGSSYDGDEEDCYIFDQAVEDAYEIAYSYGEDEFELFFDDIVGMYGIERTEESRETFEEIFAECLEAREMADDELSDIDDFGVDME